MRGIGLVVALLLVVGCSTEAPTQPEPTEPTVLALPPRPRDLWVDGVDPCSLLTEQQRAELGLDGGVLASASRSPFFGGEVVSCLVRGYQPRAVTVGIGLVTTAGVEVVREADLQASLEVVHVQGFPALRALPTRFTKFCSVLVDVGPGQLLDIQFSDGGRAPAIPQDQLCRDAERVANASMITLLG